MPEKLYYFAYGSNLHPKRLKDPKRAPSAELVTTGTVTGYCLKWHKESSDGSSKCNIIEKKRWNCLGSNI